MANTLTNLIPDLYESLDVVSRELVGFIPAIALDASANRAAVGETVYSPVTPAASSEVITPANIPPDTGDQVIGNSSITISKAKAVPFRWTGEEQRGVNNGPGYSNIRRDQMIQAMRKLVNEVETDIAATYASASRAYGTAGTTPFASDLSDAAQALKILKDNGAPESDLHLVMDTTAGVKVRSLATLNQANTAGTVALREQGILLPIFGMNLRESAQVASVTAGSVSGTTVTGANAVGATAIGVTTGAGGAVSLSAGDVVTFAGDSNKYVVASAVTIGASTTGTINIAAPGLRQATAGTEAVAVGASYTANMAFHRNSIVLAARAPEIPEEGDMAVDSTMITDPRSGLSFEVRMYSLYRRVRYEIALAWGVSLIKPEHTAILLG